MPTLLEDRRDAPAQYHLAAQRPDVRSLTVRPARKTLLHACASNPLFLLERVKASERASVAEAAGRRNGSATNNGHAVAVRKVRD
jgi:hypothetical protein